MASNRSRKFRSITGRISEIDKKLGSVDKNLQSTVNGLGVDSVSSDSILSESVGSDAIQIESITADKIAPSVFESASSGIQRVPTPLTSVDYWNSAIYGNITAFSNAYFGNKENKNVEATEQGVLFSPEANSSVPISKAQLLSGGVVLITTDSAHGYEVGDYITITNLDSPFDGEWVITSTPSVSTMCYSINQYEESSTNVDTGAYIVIGEEDTVGYKHSIVRKSFVDGVVTLSLVDETDTTATSSTHGYEVGYVVTISGLGSPYDGTHKITYVAVDKSAIIQYRPDNLTIDEFEPKISLTSAWGNGTNITYDSDDIHGISPNQIVKISGFSTSGYNLTGRVNGVYGSGSTFTIPSTATTTSPDTGGTYSCLNSSVSVEADAVLFLTGKNPVPSSRSVVISWVSNNPIKFYAVVWQSSTPDSPLFTEIDAEINGDVSYLPGLNNYAWEIPEGIDYYAIYAEVLPGSPEALLKECYVFESVGDSNKKVEKIVNASIEAVANNANKVTLYTSSTHPYNVDDTVLLSGMETVSDTLNKKFTVSAVSDDKKSFSVSVPVVNISVATTSASFTVNTNPVYNDITGATSNLDVSGKIYVGQPFTSSNVTALPNSTVTAIESVTNDVVVKTGLVATLVSGSNTVTLTTGNTEGIYSGQILLKTSGTGAFVTNGGSYVDTVTGNTTFTTTATHATSGSTTFNTAVRTITQSSFRVNNVSAGTNSAVTLSFYLPNTESTSAIALSATAIGGFAKTQTSTISPVGINQVGADGSQGLNLTDDSKTDNYLSIKTSIGESVASVSNTGAGTFKTLDADSLSVDGDITIGNENTALVGTFIDEKFNGKSYSGALLDRLARGTIYQAYWLTPSTNVETKYHGFAAGTFKLDTNRLYQVYASSSGMRASVNTNVALEFLISTTPMRVDDDTDLSHLSYTHPSQTYTTSTPSDSAKTTAIGNDSVFTTTTNSAHSHLVNVTHTHNVNISHTHTVSVFTSSFWRDLAGHFYSTSPTPVANNTTKYAITSFSRTSPNANITITLPNVAAKYMQSTDDITKMFVGVNINNRLYENNIDNSENINGTYRLTKNNRTQFRFQSYGTSTISTVQRVENLQATLSTGTSTITLTSGVTTNISEGQMLIKTSGTGEFGNNEIVYVISKTNPSTLVVGYPNGATVTHSVAGAITFEASAGEITLVDPIMTNTRATFTNAHQDDITGSMVSGSNTITGMANMANELAVGDTLYEVGSGPMPSTATVVSIVNANAITISGTASSTGGVTFDTNRVLATSDGVNHTYVIPNLFQVGQLVDVFSEDADPDWSMNARPIVSANSTQFVINPPQGNVVSNSSSTTGYVEASWSDRQVQLHRNYLPSETDLYYILRLRHQVTPSSYAITLAENPNSMLAITDLGQAKDMSFVAQENVGATWTSGLPIGYNDASSTDTTTVTETQILSASDSAYYDNYGKGIESNIPYSYLYYLYQGNSGDASGVKKSAVLFPAFDFTGKTNGLTITKLEVYLRNRNSYNSDGLTAYLAVHDSASLGSSVPLANDLCPAITTTFTKGQGKWITLPTSWHDAFNNIGTGRGILLGIVDENPDTYYDANTNYGYFDGVTLDDAPRIRVTYRYNSSVGSQNSSGGGGSGGNYIEI